MEVEYPLERERRNGHFGCLFLAHWEKRTAGFAVQIEIPKVSAALAHVRVVSLPCSSRGVLPVTRVDSGEVLENTLRHVRDIR